jgi:hypothetical protein
LQSVQIGALLRRQGTSPLCVPETALPTSGRRDAPTFGLMERVKVRWRRQGHQGYSASACLQPSGSETVLPRCGRRGWSLLQSVQIRALLRRQATSPLCVPETALPTSGRRDAPISGFLERVKVRWRWQGHQGYSASACLQPSGSETVLPRCGRRGARTGRALPSRALRLCPFPVVVAGNSSGGVVMVVMVRTHKTAERRRGGVGGRVRGG